MWGTAARWWDEQIHDIIITTQKVYKKVVNYWKICKMSFVDYRKR